MSELLVSQQMPSKFSSIPSLSVKCFDHIMVLHFIKRFFCVYEDFDSVFALPTDEVLLR